MALDDETKGLITGFDEATTAVADRIDRILTANAGGLNAEDLASLKAQFAPELARLRSLGADPVVPIPEEPPATGRSSRR